MANWFTRNACPRLGIHAIAVGLLLIAKTMPATAQTERAESAVDLVVEGRVEGVFREGNRLLIQILVQAADAPVLDTTGTMRYPAPGQYVYVHVDAEASTDGRPAQEARSLVSPSLNSPIRARLSAGKAGRWVASGQDWFDQSTARGRTNGRRSPLDQPRDAAIELGVEAERAFVGGETALKVVRVKPQSPAAKAGIEPGDVLMKAAGAPLKSQAQLEEAFRDSRDALEVTVRDVRSGRDVSVKIKSGGTSAGTDNPSPRSLGVLTETAFYGGEPALKVTEVDPQSPASNSLAPGLLILKVNGRAVGKPDELNAAVQRSQGPIEFEIVDPQDRRTRTVRIRL